MHNFTPEDLIQYLYKETSPEQTAEIMAALETDWSLREKLDVILAAQKKLEPLHLSPEQHTIDSIMNYAEKAIQSLTVQA